MGPWVLKCAAPTGDGGHALSNHESGTCPFLIRSRCGPKSTVIRSRYGPKSTVIRSRCGPKSTVIRSRCGPKQTVVRSQRGSRLSNPQAFHSKSRHIGWHIQRTKACIDKLVSNHSLLLKKHFDMARKIGRDLPFYFQLQPQLAENFLHCLKSRI